MITTPLITKLKTNGGTLYTFTSTSKDLTRVATNSADYKFRFSHFACLNLPYIMSDTPTSMEYVNGLNDNLKSVFNSIKSNCDINGYFSVNVELSNTYIEKANKSDDVKCYVSLSTFENGDKGEDMSEIGTHRYHWTYTFENIDTTDKINFSIKLTLDDEVIIVKNLIYDPMYIGNSSEKGLYLDQFPNYKMRNNDYNVAIAEHFQNYILNFESVILNNKSYNPDVLNSPAERIFFNWLRKVGGIRFTDGGNIDGLDVYKEDVYSYYPDAKKYLDRTVQYLGNIDIINQVEVNGDSFGEVYLYIPSEVGATPDVYFRTVHDGESVKTNYNLGNYEWNGYDSENIVGRERYNLEDRPIDDISLTAIYDIPNQNTYVGDNGFCIDFRNSDQFDSMNGSSYENFEFNCVLIYYDIEKTGSKPVTNLYGVLFLDNFVNDITTNVDSSKPKRLAYIDPLPKFRSSELDGGNSFALKVDLKIDTTPTTTMYRKIVEDDTYYDPNNTNDFQMFGKAMTQLQKCIDTFYTQQKEIYDIQDRLDKMESIILNMYNSKDLETEILMLKYRLNNLDIINSNDLKNQVEENSKILKDIIGGEYPTSLSLNMSKLNFGSGLAVNETNNSVNIENTLQTYSYVGRISLNDEIEGDYIYIKDDIVSFDLRKHTNLVLLSQNENDDSDLSKYEQLVINIDAINSSWSVGQSIKMTICDDFKFENIKHESLRIMTHVSTDTFIVIKDFSRDELEHMSGKTEIEIICLDNDFTTKGEKFIAIIR